MARRKLIWHIGLAHAPRSVIEATLASHHDVVEAAGVRLVADPEESRLATHELLRTHRRGGFARHEVEGSWARVCDRVWEHKGVSVLSTPDLCVADKDQVRLALDPLIGVEVHLLVTLDSFSEQLYGGWLAELRSGRATGWDPFVRRVLDHASAGVREHRQAEDYWAGHDLLSILARWGWTLRGDRVHVVAVEDPTAPWRVLVELAGLSADQLPCVLPAYAGPVASTRSIRPLVEEWQVALERAGHDVRGDLAGLVDGDAGRALPDPRDQAGVALDALVEALAENARLRLLASDLERERDRIDRKRRRWKRRALAGRAASSSG